MLKSNAIVFFAIMLITIALGKISGVISISWLGVILVPTILTCAIIGVAIIVGIAILAITMNGKDDNR